MGGGTREVEVGLAFNFGKREGERPVLRVKTNTMGSEGDQWYKEVGTTMLDRARGSEGRG